MILPLALLFGSGARGFAESPDTSLINRRADWQLPYNTAIAPLLGNPALVGYSHDYSLSEVSAGWAGDGDVRQGFFDASSFMHLAGTSDVVTGHAGYANGYIRNPGMNEASDFDIVYPYFSADTVGGRMKTETYAFDGTFCRIGEKFNWGVGLAYTAGLTWRRVDPRPRNVSGKLHINAGVGMHFGKYTAALAGDFFNYKQSCSIEFMSELGEPTIYQHTGLGNVYTRFNSLGKNNKYGGTGFTLSADLLPKSSGLFAHIDGYVFDMDYTLRDLNNLPMSEIHHKEVGAMVGWLTAQSQTFGAAALGVNALKRKGRENIFGDPSTGTYPQIASLDMYEATATEVNLLLIGVHRFANFVVATTVKGDYAHNCETYASPLRRLTFDSFDLSVRPQVEYTNAAWHLSAQPEFALHTTLSDTVDGFAGYQTAMMRYVLSEFEKTTDTLSSYALSLRADRLFGQTLIGISLSGSHNHYSNALTATLCVTF